MLFRFETCVSKNTINLLRQHDVRSRIFFSVTQPAIYYLTVVIELDGVYLCSVARLLFFVLEWCFYICGEVIYAESKTCFAGRGSSAKDLAYAKDVFSFSSRKISDGSCVDFTRNLSVVRKLQTQIRRLFTLSKTLRVSHCKCVFTVSINLMQKKYLQPTKTHYQLLQKLYLSMQYDFLVYLTSLDYVFLYFR